MAHIMHISSLNWTICAYLHHSSLVVVTGTGKNKKNIICLIAELV